jgi:plasmid stability protein
MKNITLSADEELIELARKKAMTHHRSLNDEFRAWLGSFVSEAADGEYDDIMRKFSHVEVGGGFSRDEANER